MHWHRRFWALLAMIFLAALAAPHSGAQAQITAQTLPAIRFTGAQGQELSAAQYAGRPILLHLWATWCAPCVQELPLLIQVQNDYAPYGLALLPLSQDFSADQVETFFRVNGITNLPILLDTDSEVFRALGTRGLPISILIDRKGNEVQRFAGNTNWSDPRVRALLNRLLAP